MDVESNILYIKVILDLAHAVTKDMTEEVKLMNLLWFKFLKKVHSICRKIYKSLQAELLLVPLK